MLNILLRTNVFLFVLFTLPNLLTGQRSKSIVIYQDSMGCNLWRHIYSNSDLVDTVLVLDNRWYYKSGQKFIEYYNISKFEAKKKEIFRDDFIFTIEPIRKEVYDGETVYVFRSRLGHEDDYESPEIWFSPTKGIVIEDYPFQRLTCYYTYKSIKER